MFKLHLLLTSLIIRCLIILILQTGYSVFSREPKWNDFIKCEELAVDVGVHICSGFGKGFLILDHFFLDPDSVLL